MVTRGWWVVVGWWSTVSVLLQFFLQFDQDLVKQSKNTIAFLAAFLAAYLAALIS